MQYTQHQQQRRAIQQCSYVSRSSVAASDDTWRIDMKCTFSGRTATRCCSYFHKYDTNILIDRNAEETHSISMGGNKICKLNIYHSINQSVNQSINRKFKVA